MLFAYVIILNIWCVIDYKCAVVKQFCWALWKRQLTSFSPLGKLAGRTIYFACVNLFFNFFYYEQSYLSFHWTDFHDLFIKWKIFAWIFLIRSSFSNTSRDVAMATNLVPKWGKITYPLHLSFSHSETEWDIAASMCALTAQMMPLYV